MPEPGSPRVLRADAERNRRRILDAAEEVFALQGNGLRMGDVAERADVGKATLYRTFPTRGSLIDAMAFEQLGRFRDRATAAMHCPDVVAALRDLLVPDEEPSRAGLGAALSELTGHEGSPELAEVRDGAVAALEFLLERGKTQGLIRPEVTSRHLGVFFTGLARALTWPEITDAATYREYSMLIFNAIRTHPE